MPIQIKTIEATGTFIINTARITNIEIDVKKRKITVAVDYGEQKYKREYSDKLHGIYTTIPDYIAVKDSQTVVLTDNDFNSIASEMVISNGDMTIYDVLANVAYNWLKVHNKLKYEVTPDPYEE